MSVLRVSVTVECGVWTLDYESAVSGEPPKFITTSLDQFMKLGINLRAPYSSPLSVPLPLWFTILRWT